MRTARTTIFDLQALSKEDVYQFNLMGSQAQEGVILHVFKRFLEYMEDLSSPSSVLLERVASLKKCNQRSVFYCYHIVIFFFGFFFSRSRIDERDIFFDFLLF